MQSSKKLILCLKYFALLFDKNALAYIFGPPIHMLIHSKDGKAFVTRVMSSRRRQSRSLTEQLLPLDLERLATQTYTNKIINYLLLLHLTESTTMEQC